MKTKLFFVADNYNTAKLLASKVAKFFDMRIFDSVEMFEFDHSPRKIDEVLKELGENYVKKEMKSIIRMQLDFNEAVFVADLKYINQMASFLEEIKSQNLIIYVNINNKLTENEKFNKIELLTDVCDIAINAIDLSEDDLFNEVVLHIKNYYHIEA